MINYPIHIPYSIVLGSQSPRRKQLLEGMGLEFEIQVIPTNEDFDKDWDPITIAKNLAKMKNECFTGILKADPKKLVITADTIVSINNTILNKPGSKEEAVHMLNTLSGNKHTVYTGVCISTSEKTENFVTATDVYFNALNEKEIDYYIETCKPYDKAGSYGVQEWMGYIGISKIEGCFFNVMGLPVNELYKKLQLFSV